MARLSPDNPDNTRTADPLSGDIPTRTDRTYTFRYVRLSGVRTEGSGDIQKINRWTYLTRAKVHLESLCSGGLSRGAGFVESLRSVSDSLVVLERIHGLPTAAWL
jgi:hypothetical protein